MSDVMALARPAGLPRIFRDYLELSKSRIVMMVLITTAAGYFFAAPHADWMLLINTLVGTALVAAGTNALNQYAERDHDARMKRTRLRPLPDGRISPLAALLFSITIAVTGTVYLGLAVNWLTAALGAFTLTSYIFVYTPLKRVSTICTLIGAIPGAIPPLMGWTAATGSIGAGGWIISPSSSFGSSRTSWPSAGCTARTTPAAASPCWRCRTRTARQRPGTRSFIASRFSP